MATVRIYYSREDQDYANHELYIFPGVIKPQGELLFLVKILTKLTC